MSELYNSYFFNDFYEENGGGNYTDKEKWMPFFDGIAEKLIALFNPKTVLDAGCALGYLVSSLRKRGVEAYGIDISNYAINNADDEIKPFCKVCSLTDEIPADFPKKFDLIVTIEVLEHLFPEEGAKAIKNLCSMTDTIIFTSTPDDITDKTHVNVQKSEYWAEIFAKNSFYRDLVQKVDFICPWAALFNKKNNFSRIIFDYELNMRVEKMQITEANEKLEGKIYFNTGEGYNENEILLLNNIPRSGNYICKNNIPQNAVSVRIDPCEEMCVLSNIYLKTDKGFIENYINNGFLTDGYLIFLHSDPHLDIRIDMIKPQWIELEFQILIFENKYHKFLNKIIKEVKSFSEKETEKKKQADIKNELERYKIYYHNAVLQRDEAQRKLEAAELNYTQISNAGFWKMTKPFRLLFNAVKKIPFIRFFGKAIRYIKHNGLKKAFIRLFKRKSNDKKLNKANVLNASERERQKNYKFNKNIKFSILVPLYNTPEKFLKEMIESVLNQTYSDWELCMADGSDSEHNTVGKICLDYVKKDKRIKYEKLSENLGISGNTNACIDMSTGDYIGLFDHDDILHPSALYENMKAICEKDADFIYSDENSFIKTPLDAHCPHFKPDFSPDTLRSYNYICHFTVFKKSLLEQTGNFRSEFDGSQDYDLILRLTEKAKRIVHIQKILYYWRAHKGSVASDISAKPYTLIAAKKALSEHLERTGLQGSVEDASVPSVYRIRYQIDGNPLVSILIPNMDYINDLEKCINSILNKSTYLNYEIMIIENNSKNIETFDYYDALKNNEKIKVVTWENYFNYSLINNFGFENASGSYIIFLNNDVEITTPDWIQEMLMFSQRKEVGAVGMMLYYPDDTIQHAGVIVGLGGVAGHSHKNFIKDSSGYSNRLKLVQNLSAVTAACMMVRSDVFKAAGGFNEDFEVAFNDVDLCMKIRKAGYLIVWTPFAEAYHYESKSRGSEDTPEKQKRFQKEVLLFQKIWENELKKGDPYYNPNLTLDSEDFRLK